MEQLINLATSEINEVITSDALKPKLTLASRKEDVYVYPKQGIF